MQKMPQTQVLGKRNFESFGKASSRNEPPKKMSRWDHRCSNCNKLTYFYCTECKKYICKSNCEQIHKTLSFTKDHPALINLKLHETYLKHFREMITSEIQEITEFKQKKLEIAISEQRIEVLQKVISNILNSHFGQIAHIKNFSSEQMQNKIKQIHEEIEAKSKFIITMSVGESEYVTCLFDDLTTKPWSIREMKNKIRDKGIEIGESKYDSWIIAEENLKRLAEAPKINLFFFKDGRVGQIAKTRKIFICERYPFIFKNSL